MKSQYSAVIEWLATVRTTIFWFPVSKILTVCCYLKVETVRNTESVAIYCTSIQCRHSETICMLELNHRESLTFLEQIVCKQKVNFSLADGSWSRHTAIMCTIFVLYMEILGLIFSGNLNNYIVQSLYKR